jgi:hypothetical protein
MMMKCGRGDKKNQNVAKYGGIQRGKENIERKANKNIFGSHVGL